MPLLCQECISAPVQIEFFCRYLWLQRLRLDEARLQLTFVVTRPDSIHGWTLQCRLVLVLNTYVIIYPFLQNSEKRPNLFNPPQPGTDTHTGCLNLHLASV